MPKVRVDIDLETIELDEQEDVEEIIGGIEKFSHVRRTKMKDENARYKNKKQNKGRERHKEKT